MYDPSSRRARFVLRFGAPSEGAAAECADVRVETGDGKTIEVGSICAPSSVDWRAIADIEVGRHTYAGKGPFVAALIWGSERYEAPVGTPKAVPQQTPNGAPTLALFQARRDRTDPYTVTINVRMEGLGRNQRVRIDSGAGQAFFLEGAMAAQENALTAVYYKHGVYTIAADLLDADGFRVASLGETSIEIADAEPEMSMAAPADIKAAPASVREVQGDIEVPIVINSAPVWLPFRYARPNWAWTRTYTEPGGRVSRSLAPGTYVAIRKEVATNGQIWFQTGAFDWIPASSVTIVIPSELRGVLLDGSGTQPPPPPPPPPPPDPPPPTTEKKGTVIAGVLNVRARPGVFFNNPPIGSLRYGATVSIFEETTVAGAKWYRIGENRWVHAGYVRLINAASNDDEPSAEPLPEPPTSLEPVGAPAPASLARVDLPLGWVVSPTLNVRKTPNGEIVGELQHNQMVPILEEATAAGSRWYRIGQDQWTSATWIGVARAKSRPSSIKADERWVGVCLKEQTAIAYEGDKPVYAALIASGTAGSPTVQGIFKTWWRLESRRMAGPGYFLEEVTWTCYFHGGYALHTAYWHDAFGRPRSHGCVNLSPYDAWWIFQWSAPGGENAPSVYTYWI
jgi:hypothetical protein